jgi:hypothetical protein
MPLIPREPKKERTHLHLRVDAGVIAELDLYSRFIDSPKDYVIENMLAFVLRKDRDFQDWLATNRPDPAAGTPIVDTNHNGAASAATAAVTGTTAARRRTSTTEAA